MASVLCVSMLLIPHALFAREDDEMVREYPDGDFGIVLGHGYEDMPAGKNGDGGYELVPPPGFREEYQDTRYGAMTGEGFVVFPGFSFQAPPKKVEEKKSELQKEYIFHETTTSTSTTLWGVSSPKKRTKTQAK
ncbi:MAG: hypothetical protein KAS86_02170 [Candidatus Omnitrophica bacterium]|nr:hypothetical protein [Candidatus Omnitrophota bacterium]